MTRSQLISSDRPAVNFYYSYVQPVLSTIMAAVVIWLGATTLDSSKKVSSLLSQPAAAVQARAVTQVALSAARPCCPASATDWQ